MHTLREVEIEAAADLDPEGEGVQTSQLGKTIFDRVKAECGYLSANGQQLMREGASRRAQRYQAPRTRLAKDVGNTSQRDMIELDAGFAFFVQDWVALGESDAAFRKPLLKMNLPEFEAAIALLEKKADETAAQALSMRKVLLNNPSWRQAPKLTLEKMLRIVLFDDQPAAGPSDRPSADHRMDVPAAR